MMFEQTLFDMITKSTECSKIFGSRIFSGTAPSNILDLGKPFIVSCDLTQAPINRNLSSKNESFLHLFQIDIFADEMEQLKVGEKAVKDSIKECKFDNFTLRVYDYLIPIGSKVWLTTSSDLIVTI